MFTEATRSINHYVKSIEVYPVLSAEEEESLFREYNETKSEVLKEKLINSNLRLVVKIAHDFTNMGVAFWDLIGSGNIGLMKAVDNYEIGKGTKFSSYAAFWIKAEIKKELSSFSRSVSIDINTTQTMRKVKNLVGKGYSVEEIAEQVKNVSKRKIRNLINGYSEFSMNEKIDGEEVKEKGELIEDNRYNPFDEVDKKDMLQNIIDKCKEKLSDRDMYIFFSRYGLDGKEIKSQIELAEEFDMTHQRVQQVEKEIIKMLKKEFTKISIFG